MNLNIRCMIFSKQENQGYSKYFTFLFSLIILTAIHSCRDKASVYTSWYEINISKINNSKDLFYMYNEEGKKVGSMLQKILRKNDTIYFSDISQFDDGSVYEEAIFKINCKTLKIQDVRIYFKVGENYQHIKYVVDQNQIIGTNEYKIRGEFISNKIDTIIDFDFIRPGIFALINAAKINDTITRNVKILNASNLRVASAKIRYTGKEEITIKNKKLITNKVFLNGGNVIPDNILYVGGNQLQRIEILRPILQIELIESKLKMSNSNVKLKEFKKINTNFSLNSE